jgi:ribosomal subunit interface protein
MDVRITARHCAVPESTRHKAAEEIQRLSRLAPRAAAAQVRFEKEHGAPHVETQLSVPGRASMIASATAASFRAALDQAVTRLERQLQRRRRRQQRRRGGARPASLAMADE